MLFELFSKVFAITQKDSSAGGSSTAEVRYGGGGSELGSIISYYTGNLSYNGDSIYTYNYQGQQGVTYAASGTSSVSSSHKFHANVK